MARVEITIEDNGPNLTVRYWTDLPEAAQGTPATNLAFSWFRLIELHTGFKFQVSEVSDGTPDV